VSVRERHCTEIAVLGMTMLFCVGAAQSSRATPAEEPERVPLFADPKTDAEIRKVVRILKSYPPTADIAPYLMPHRLERLAELLVKLGRYHEARDTLWRICDRTPVMYKGRAFHYGRLREAHLVMLFDQPLWDERDVARRLKQPRKYFIDEQVTALYEYRRMLASGKLDLALDHIVKAQSNWPFTVEMVVERFRDGKLGLMMRLLVQTPGAYAAVLARYRQKMPFDRHEALPLVFLLGELHNRDALADLVEGLYYPVANDRFVRELLDQVLERMAPPSFLAKLGEIYDAKRRDYLRPFDTRSFQAVSMGIGKRHDSLAEVDDNGLRLLPDPMRWLHRIAIKNPSVVDLKRRGKLIVRFRVDAEQAHSDQPLDYTDVEITLTQHLWLEDLR
jgi:hypothetical protein